VSRRERACAVGRYLAWPIPEFAHLLLVPHQFAIEFLDVDLDRGYPRVCLGHGVVSDGVAGIGRGNDPQN
jgi:hypothetical protein